MKMVVMVVTLKLMTTIIIKTMITSMIMLILMLRINANHFLLYLCLKTVYTCSLGKKSRKFLPLQVPVYLNNIYQDL